MAARMSKQSWQNIPSRLTGVDVSGDQGKQREGKLDSTPEGLCPLHPVFRGTPTGTPDMPFVVQKRHYDEGAARHPVRRLGETERPDEPGVG